MFTTLLASLLLYLGTVQAAAIMHTHMLHNVLHAPNAFFDVTPLGRILNRFSKDVDVLDNTLPMTLRGWCTCFFSVRFEKGFFFLFFFSEMVAFHLEIFGEFFFFLVSASCREKLALS